MNLGTMLVNWMGDCSGPLKLGHVMSAPMGIPRLRSMSFLYLNALLRSLSICFPQVLLMSTHRFSMVSVINVVTN